jgi:antiviral defense system Shedu protein SduA
MTAEDLSDVKTMLAEDFESTADWRETKATEYPEDDRNLRSAEGLRSLATYVRALPNDDPRLLAIEAVLSSDNFDITTPNMMLSRYGFGPGSHLGLPDQDTFFTSYAEEWTHYSQLESAYREDPDRVRRLIIDDESAHDVVALEHRRVNLAKFRRLLSDSDFFDKQIPQGQGPEAVWQRFLEDNQWIFGSSLSLQFLASWDEKRLEQVVVGSSIGSVGKRVDALLRTTGLVHSMIFVEIKHHRTKLLEEEYRPGCWSPSKELSGGVAQVQGTVQRSIATWGSRLSERASDGSAIPGAFTYLLRPRSFLVVGSFDELIGEAKGINHDKYQSFELYRRHTQEPDIITFDELFARAEGMVQIAAV